MSAQPNLGSRLAFAIGAQRRLEHDEMDDLFMYKGEQVRVREKIRVESSADPSLLSLWAKLGALERTVEAARVGLGILMGEGLEGRLVDETLGVMFVCFVWGEVLGLGLQCGQGDDGLQISCVCQEFEK